MHESGRHWLLLRGLIRESAHWGDFLPLLKSAFPEDKVTTLDLPGTGVHYQQLSPTGVPEILECVRQQAQAQGLLKQPVLLLAMSLGGMVAWQWLTRYPEEIAAACLVNISFADRSPCYQRLRWQSWPAFLKISAQRDAYKREAAILQLISNRPAAANQSVAQNWAEIARLRPISAANRLRQIIAAARYQPGDSAPQAPVLLLAGSADRMVASACTQAIQRKWSLPLRCHDWAGHDLSLD
ncbi:MAG: alpha/beta hydrolase, partial [Methylococcales bacterium]